MRYLSFGEPRLPTSDQETLKTYTDKTYTGQCDDGFKLLDYNARFYDPYLNRFLSPDSIVPDQYNPLDWDRYSYCRNNPINFNDPSGHWPTWPVPPVPPPYPIVSWLTGNAENVYQLIALGIAHTDDANIVGEGLQSLKDDPRVMAAHDKIVEDIRDFPEYNRNEPFVMEKYGNEKFQAMGNNENWREAAWEGNQAFFMVYTGTLSATNTPVSADGTISTTWQVSDNFDYLPDFENRGFEYNLYACINYFVYNVVLGAKEQYPTSAKWNETIPPPQNRKGGQQQK